MTLYNVFAQLLVLSAATAAAAEHSPRPNLYTRENTIRAGEDDCTYDIDGVGSFTSELIVDFTTLSSLPSDLIASTYTVGAGSYAPFSRQFNASNVLVSSGQPVQLLMPGDQSTSPVQCAQMTTSFDDVLYASVRTVAKASAVNGTVHGFFMYMNDTQETDIEFRTTDLSVVHFTNQATSSDSAATTVSVAVPDDVATAFHEYRYDWLEDRCDFYIDGELSYTITSNVPSQAGRLEWNNWANGGSFSLGPPLADSILEIKSIEAYFNRTSLE